MALPALVHPSLFDIRTDLCSVGRVVLPVTTMLSVDELIYTCTLTCPSVLGSLSHLWFFCLLCQLGNWGGRPFPALFALFALFSCPRVFSVFQKHVTRRTVSCELIDDLLHKERLLYNYLSNSLHQLGSYFETQIMFRNVLAESRGLSKSGRHLMSRLGFLLPETTYQRRLTKLLQVHDRSLRYIETEFDLYLLF